MVIQGFGPIPGAAYNPPKRERRKVHTIHTLASDQEAMRLAKLAKNVEALQLQSEALQLQKAESNHSLRHLVDGLKEGSAERKKMLVDVAERVDVLEKELEVSEAFAASHSKIASELEEANKKTAQELETLRHDSLLSTCATHITKVACCVVQFVYSIFQTICRWMGCSKE